MGGISRRRFLAGSGTLGAALVVGACSRDREAGSGWSSPDSTAAEDGPTAPPATGPTAPDPAPDYVPPPDDTAWARVSPGEAGWDPHALADAFDFAGDRRSRSVVLVTGGRIVAERQWGVAPGWSRDIASCQKSVVAVLCVIGRDEGWLDLDASVTDVVGAGWSLEGDARAEARITVRHLMSMTSGLDPGLRVAAEPGTVWEYDNDAYHRLHAVLEAAAGTDLETLTRSRLWEPIGVRGARWVRRAGTGRVSVDAAGHPLSGLVMNAYDLARFALLVQRRGRWGDRTVVPAGAIDELLSPSSDLNPSYGLLWWLNGADAHRLPGRNPPLVAGPLVPGAPSDLVAALGANGQKAYVAPSLDSVLTRLGRRASGELLSALSGFDDEWWTRLGAARVA